MFKFTPNHKTISEVNQMFIRDKLVVDETYQRRSVWGEKDKIRLIETILLELVIPELFFWIAKTDPTTGDITTNIVDGQQRVKAIAEFINNEFRLKKQHLIDNNIKENYGDVYFKDLTDQTKNKFWQYQLMIIDIDAGANHENIKEMFRRLNLTNYNLNAAEKRNSLSSEFANLAMQISYLEFWSNNSLFNITDVKRMRDVEFCGTIILLYKKGIIDQTDQKALNQAYEDFQKYQDAENDKGEIEDAINIISEFFISDETIRFIKKKSQLYTIFSIVFFMKRELIIPNEQIKQNFKDFVKLYSIFSNNINLDDQLTENEKTIFDWLKKYKLASSEGLNKHVNRNIRTNVLKDFLFNEINKDLLKAKESLYTKMFKLFNNEGNNDPDDF